MAFNYRRANAVLLTLIIIINGYVIAAPFWPRAVFWVQERTPRASELSHKVKTKPTPGINKPDTLTIPRMQFDGQINQGSDTYAELAKGAWLWPDGSRPDKGSNTIILGHRFTYTNPRGVFYFMDKLQKDDTIGVTWHNKQYVYKVTETRIVNPTEISILAPTRDAQLTLYTCTPLWNPTKRLVVTAKLEDQL